jgi:hypothetical protein
VDTGTFEYVDAPEGRKVITCKWVFSVKRNQWNKFERFKARLVARGFTQIYGIDYQETFAPVVKFTSLCIMFALAAHYGLTIYQMYVVTAFLNADLDEEIYMSQPPGLPPKLHHEKRELLTRADIPLHRPHPSQSMVIHHKPGEITPGLFIDLFLLQSSPALRCLQALSGLPALIYVY